MPANGSYVSERNYFETEGQRFAAIIMFVCEHEEVVGQTASST
jgi:hypothetical protein